MVYKGITITKKIYSNFKSGDIVISRGVLKNFPKDMACPIIRFYYDSERVSGVVIKNSLGEEVKLSERSLIDYFEAPLLDDAVEHPSHYTWLKDKCGIEVIDITRHLDFDLGNSIKYILRAGRKPLKFENKSDFHAGAIQDLKKAIFYLNDKIKMLENKKE